MHLATYRHSDAGRLIAHYDRSIGTREHIDQDGTVVCLTSGKSAKSRYAALTKDLELTGKSRPLADFLVTMPRGYEGDPQEFFDAACEYLRGRVGDDRVVCAYVHYDEPGAQPHMHFAFVPVVESVVMTNDKDHPLRYTKRDERKNAAHKAGTVKRDSKGTVRYKRVPKLDADTGKPVVRRTATCSRLFSKKDMANLHPDMESWMCQKLGVARVGLLLDEDDARKSLSGLAHHEYERVTAEMRRATEGVEQAKSDLEVVQAEKQAAEDARDAAQAEVEDAEARLECLRRAESAFQSTEKASLPSLVRAAGDRPDPARKRELEEENRRLREKVSELGKRHQSLAEGRAALAARVAALRDHVARAQARVMSLLSRVPAMLARGWQCHVQVLALEAESAAITEKVANTEKAQVVRGVESTPARAARVERRRSWRR